MLNKNLFIEGDNIDALLLLQQEYTNKVKMIYIDPPYNTGKKFIYKDKHADVECTHATWINMMKPRLELARNLLKEDGVIFISIDDSEQPRLRLLCDSIFGEENFVSTIVWQKKCARQNDAKYFSANHDFILCYAKIKKQLKIYGLPRTEKQDQGYKNPDNNSRGVWKAGSLTVARHTEKDRYPLMTPGGQVAYPTHGRSWKTTKEKMQGLIADNRIYFPVNGKPMFKCFLSDVKQSITPTNLWMHEDVGHTTEATKQLKALFDGHRVFDYSKPVRLIKQMLTLTTKDDDIVLDFFAGSATTAHAVMDKNSEDGGNRKYIMVQIAEDIDFKSAAYSNGYNNIAEIALDRIRRASKLYENTDTKFIHYKIIDKELFHVEH